MTSNSGRVLLPFGLLVAIASAPVAAAPDSETPLRFDREQRAVRFEALPSRDAALAERLSARGAEPRSLASEDFDRDGFPDLAVGAALRRGGLLTIRYGSAEAFGPTKPETIRGILDGDYPPPFRESGTVLELPTAADFLAAGDFDGDLRTDLVAASRTEPEILLLHGREDGSFDRPIEVPIPGTVTALVAGRPETDEWPGLVLAVSDETGARLLMWRSGRNVATAAPEIAELPAAATSMVSGRLDDDRFPDLALVAGRRAFVLHGSFGSPAAAGFPPDPDAGRLVPLDVVLDVRQIALGDFSWDRDSRMELAVVGGDGTVTILSRGELDSRPYGPEEIRERLRVARGGNGSPETVRAAPRSAAALPWRVLEREDARVVHPNGARLLPILATGRRSVDLVIGDPGAGTVAVSFREDGDSGERRSVKMGLADRPVAILPMRLSVHARPGLVLLLRGRIDPLAVGPTVLATYSVDRLDDPDPATQPCTGAANDCSLRGAVRAANAAGGANTISFATAAGSPIRLSRAGDENLNSTGDLDVNSSITFLGNGAASTIIQSSTDVNFTGNMGDKAIGVNQDGTFATLTVALSGLTVRWTRNDIAVNGLFTQTGGAMDIFLTGTGGSPGPTTTITNCTFDGNASAHSYGGGLNVDSGDLGGGTNIFRGSVSIAGSTFSGNKTLETGVTSNQPNGGGINLQSDKHDVTISTTTISGNSTAHDNGNGGGLNVRHSYGGTIQLTTDTIQNNTAKGYGGGVMISFNQTLNLNGGTVSGNSSTHSVSPNDAGGGGIYCGAGTPYVTTISNVTISGNHADTGTTGMGGGVYCSSSGPVNLSGCTITGNTADTGAGVLAWLGTLSISGGSITSNTAAVSGGGFASVQPNAASTLTNVTITGNSAVTGGALYVSDGTLNASLCRIVSNTATTGQGIARASLGTATVEKNWWACDGFPNAAGCQTGSGTYDADPRIDLRLSASSGTIAGGGTSTLTADVVKDTNGANTNGGNAPTAMVGVNFVFASDSKGSINAPLTVAIPAGGSVAKTFTAGSTSVACGTSNPGVTVDSGTVTTPIVIQCTNLGTSASGPSTAWCGDAVSWTYTITNSGVLAAATSTFSADLPDCLTGVTCTPSVGTCNVSAGNVLSGSLGTIAVAGSVTVTIGATAAAGCRPSVAPVGAAGTATVDSSTANDSATAPTLTITCSPQAADPTNVFTARKGSGTSVVVTYAPACNATNHVAYTRTAAASGPLVWSGSVCALGIVSPATFNVAAPPANSCTYFVLVGQDGREGSFGKDSANVERPAAPAIGACPQTQNLAGSC